MNADINADMNDIAAQLDETVRAVFADHLDDAAVGLRAEFDATLWSVLEQAGLTLLSTPESAGGSGGGIADSAVLLSVAGEYAVPLPLAETDLLAGWLLAACGMPVPPEPLTAVTGDLAISSGSGDLDGETIVSGRLERVPWARHAGTIVALVPSPGAAVVVVLPAGSWTLTEGENLAREPRDDVEVQATLSPGAVATAPPGAERELWLRGALARALLLAAAGERALELMIRYAGEREQFGRPISRFQAVTQQIALAAGEVAAGRAATDAAVRVAANEGFDDPRTALAVAVAKSRTSAAAETVAAVAHQVHGAIGFTLEHRLRLVTTRMWAWREEFGNEVHWDEEIGALALAAGGNGVWPLITSAG